MAAGLVVAGASLDAAVEFVHASSTGRTDRRELAVRSRHPLLWNDLRGDLMMLGEDLTPEAGSALLRSLSHAAATSEQPALAFDFVDRCGELLGIV